MKKHALLIGVEEYRDKMISRLQFARADAIALAGRLRDRCAFDNVHVLVEEGGDNEPLVVNVIRAMEDISAELQQEDLFLFFFAGHGIEKDGRGYLLTRESRHGFPEHGSLSLEELRKALERLGAGKRLLLLDACRNGPDAGRSDTGNFMGDVTSRDIMATAMSRLDVGNATALLAACRSGQRAYEWPAKGHGVFTHYLCEGLDGPAWHGPSLDFGTLASYVSKRTREWNAAMHHLPTPQHPWYEHFGDPGPIVLAGDLVSGQREQDRSRPTSPLRQLEGAGSVQAANNLTRPFAKYADDVPVAVQRPSPNTTGVPDGKRDNTFLPVTENDQASISVTSDEQPHSCESCTTVIDIYACYRSKRFHVVCHAAIAKFLSAKMLRRIQLPLLTFQSKQYYEWRPAIQTAK